MSLKPGLCFGKWDMKDSACSKCLEYVRIKCEETTKRINATPLDTEGVVDSDNGQQKVNDYFLRLLEGKLDRKVIWGEPVVQNQFFKDGKIFVFVSQNFITGKIRYKTHTVDKLIRLESIEQAEVLAKELIG